MTEHLFGLTPETIEKIRNIFRKFPKISKAILYGSRAKGNFREGSDIDLTLDADGLSYSERLAIEIELDDLREHIERIGRVFYSKL